VLILLGLAAAVVSVAGLRAFGDTLGPAFLALVLVITVHPVQAALLRRGVPAWLAIIALLATVYAILLLLAGALTVSVARLVTLLPTYAEEFSDLLDQLTRWLVDLGVSEDQIRDAVSRLDLSNVVGVLQRVAGGLTAFLSDLTFVVVLIFFLGIDAARFPLRLQAVAGSHPQLIAALDGFARGTRRYLAVATVFGLIVAVIDVAALYWLAIPVPLVWGLLSFITNYIPNIGFVVGMIPPALLGLLEGGVGRMVAVVVAYSLINFVIQSLIQPKVVGDAVGLTVTLTFLSLVFWGYVFGALGALLAIPLSLLVKALLVDADPGTHWLRPLLGDSSGAGAGPSEDEDADPPGASAAAADQPG